jgi:predicted choloylglycine hydrolase
MERQLRAVEELEAGAKWQAVFHSLWPAYHAWFLTEGDAARPSYLAARQALQRYMPELVPTYERLAALAGGGDSVARFLSLYCPTPYMTGCSQAVWSRGDPILVRNYDYHPRLWDAVILHSAWNGRRVIASTDCVWGVLDGMNEDGLAVSLAFGGRKAVGEGFGIPLVLRYVLEFCRTTREAVSVLRHVPSHMSYNVTVCDSAGQYKTVHVAPDRPTVVTKRPVATNHQEWIEWSRYAEVTGSVERQKFLDERLIDRRETADGLVQRFLEPPLYSTRFDHGWGTLYTVDYRPRSLVATFRWPHIALTLGFDRFEETTLALTYKMGLSVPPGSP